MDKTMRFFAGLAILALAGCSHGSNATGNASNATAPSVAKIGAQAPAFNEPTVAGPSLSMAELHGKPVYLNFFATWCPPCNEEAPDVSAVAQQFKNNGLQVVGVDVLENQKKAQIFVDQHHLSYPAVVDSGTLRDAYNINGMPVHVFIDRSGVVKKIVIGELSKSEMIANIKSIL